MFYTSLEKHEVMNVACGNEVSLNELVRLLRRESGRNIYPHYVQERVGDVRHSKASINKIGGLLNYSPEFTFEEGLSIAYNWYKKNS